MIFCCFGHPTIKVIIKTDGNMNDTFAIQFILNNKQISIDVRRGRNIGHYVEYLKEKTSFSIDSFVFLNNTVKNITHDTLVDVFEPNPVIYLVHTFR